MSPVAEVLLAALGVTSVALGAVWLAWKTWG